MLFEEFVFTPYIETLFVIVGVLIDEIKKKNLLRVFMFREERFTR